MPRVLGLDLGSHTIKAVELRPGLRRVDVVQLRAAPRHGDGPPLPELLRELVQTHELSTESPVCAVPGDRISVRPFTFPFRDRRRIAQAVPFEVEGTTPFDLDEVVVDWLPIRSDRGQTEVCAAVAPRVEVAWLLETLAQAGIDPRVVEAEGIALGNLAGFFDLPGIRLLADLGHRKTTLCLLRDGRPIGARTLVLGSRGLTEAIAKDRHVELSEAERIKCEEGVFGADLAPRGAGTAAALDRFARELARSLGAASARLDPTSGERIEELTLLGGGARLHRIDEYLASRLGVPTARLSPPPDAALVAAGDPLVFAPALALALRGTPLATTRVNFRQGEFAQRLDLSQLRGRLRPTLWLAAAVVALAVLAGSTHIIVNSRRASALEAEAARIHAAVLPDRPAQGGHVAGVRDALGEARDRADFLGVYGGDLSTLDVLTEIAARVPEDVEVVIQDLRIEGSLVRLRGFARNVQVLDRLEADLAGFAPFSRVKVDDIQDDARRSGYTFNLVIGLGDAGGDT